MSRDGIYFLFCLKAFIVHICLYQAVDRLRAGALAMEAVAAALVELEVSPF